MLKNHYSHMCSEYAAPKIQKVRHAAGTLNTVVHACVEIEWNTPFGSQEHPSSE